MSHTGISLKVKLPHLTKSGEHLLIKYLSEMIKLILKDTGKQIECLAIEESMVWMTDQQIMDAGIKEPQYLGELLLHPSIETDRGKLVVTPGIDIAGEAISPQSIGNLLYQARENYIGKLNLDPNNKLCKERVARIVCIFGHLCHDEDSKILSDIASDLQCTEAEAKQYLESDRQNDTVGDEVDIMGESITYDSLDNLLADANDWMCEENNSHRHEILKGKETTPNDFVDIKRLDERIGRCHYLRYLLDGLSPSEAVRYTAATEGITEEECRDRLRMDRFQIG